MFNKTSTILYYLQLIQIVKTVENISCSLFFNVEFFDLSDRTIDCKVFVQHEKNFILYLHLLLKLITVICENYIKI
jgi:hypothetical protein